MSATALRRTQITLLLIGAIVTIMMIVVVAGCYRDDSSIDAHRATATADVVTRGRHEVDGAVLHRERRTPRPSPRHLLPDGTRTASGQRISVEYDSTNPDLVRVAGRDANLAIIPAVSVAELHLAAHRGGDGVARRDHAPSRTGRRCHRRTGFRASTRRTTGELTRATFTGHYGRRHVEVPWETGALHTLDACEWR